EVCTAVADGNHVLVGDSEGRRLSILAFGNPQPMAFIDESWVSRCYGSRRKALVAGFVFEACGPRAATTVIVPSANSGVASVEGHVVQDSCTHAIQLRSGSTADIVLIGDGKKPARCGPLFASAQLAWGRTVEGRLVRACMMHGDMIQASDRLMLNSEM